MSQNEGPDCRICVKQLVILAQLGTDREDASLHMSVKISSSFSPWAHLLKYHSSPRVLSERPLMRRSFEVTNPSGVGFPVSTPGQLGPGYESGELGSGKLVATCPPDCSWFGNPNHCRRPPEVEHFPAVAVPAWVMEAFSTMQHGHLLGAVGVFDPTLHWR